MAMDLTDLHVGYQILETFEKTSSFGVKTFEPCFKAKHFDGNQDEHYKFQYARSPNRAMVKAFSGFDGQRSVSVADFADILMLNHKNVLRHFYLRHKEGDSVVYSVQEFMPLGDIKTFLTRTHEEFQFTQWIEPQNRHQTHIVPLTRNWARRWVIQMANALHYTQTNVIPHGKITLECIYIDSDLSIKIGDFEHTRLMGYQAQPGSPQELPKKKSDPEIEQTATVESRYHTDMWSLGVVLYTLIAGQAPFEVPSETFTQAAKGFCRMPGYYYHYVCQDTLALALSMMNPCPADREPNTVDGLLEHPFFRTQKRTGYWDEFLFLDQQISMGNLKPTCYAGPTTTGDECGGLKNSEDHVAKDPEDWMPNVKDKALGLVDFKMRVAYLSWAPSAAALTPLPSDGAVAVPDDPRPRGPNAPYPTLPYVECPGVTRQADACRCFESVSEPVQIQHATGMTMRIAPNIPVARLQTPA